MFYGVSKFGSGLVGLNNVVFCNPDFISVKSVDKIYIQMLQTYQIHADNIFQKDNMDYNSDTITKTMNNRLKTYST